jgi:hypothetical protein
MCPNSEGYSFVRNSTTVTYTYDTTDQPTGDGTNTFTYGTGNRLTNDCLMASCFAGYLAFLANERVRPRLVADDLIASHALGAGLRSSPLQVPPKLCARTRAELAASELETGSPPG